MSAPNHCQRYRPAARRPEQASEVTLAEQFKSQGYATGMASKWHLGASEQSWPTRQGFDEYHVGVMESSDGTLYRESMLRSGMPEDVKGRRSPISRNPIRMEP